MAGTLSTEEYLNGAPRPTSDVDALRWPGFFLQRLRRLVSLKELDQLTSQERRLVDHALYSTYWDCAELGLRTEARQVLGLPVD